MRFKIGDRVRVKEEYSNKMYRLDGGHNIYVVSEVKPRSSTEDWLRFTDFDFDAWASSCFELVKLDNKARIEERRKCLER